MKIAKALKLKNRLAGEVSRLKGLVMANNSRMAANTPDYDVQEIFEVELQKRIKELVLVKTAIACSNSSMVCATTAEGYSESPFWAVFMIAELKGLIQTLRSTGTQHGSIGNQYDPSVKPVDYVAVYEPVDVDKFVVDYQTRIDELQEILDTHNATFNCDVLDEIKM
jgi:hypothetical protein